jgi:hypothetical protein
MFGWPELARTVAGVYHSLPPAEQAVCGVYTQNYGQAGAIDFFGPALGLPPACSGHNSYWFWGPGEITGEVLIIVGGEREDHLEEFASCELAATHSHPYARAFETELPIWVCRGLRLPVAEVWPHTREFI